MRVMVTIKATKHSEAGVMPSEALPRKGLHPSRRGKRVPFSGGTKTVLARRTRLPPTESIQEPPVPDADTPTYVVPPPIPPVVALALIIILDRLVPVPFLPRALSLTVGLPLLVLGVGLWAWGVTGLLRRGESPDPPEANHSAGDRRTVPVQP